MECLCFLVRLDLHPVLGGEDLVRNRSPAVPLNPLVPAIEVVFLGLVESDVDFVFLEFSLHFHVVARGKGVDVDDAPVGEDLVVD